MNKYIGLMVINFVTSKYLFQISYEAIFKKKIVLILRFPTTPLIK